MTSIDSSKEMILTSDYPMDKVVYLESDSFSMPGSTLGYLYSFDHNLPFTPLCGGNWSLVSSFSSQYEYSSGTVPSGNPGYVFNRTINIFATSKKIYLTCDNLGSTVTVYFRVYGFEPQPSAALLSPIAALGDKFALSSDYNNPKLYLDNFIDLPGSTGSVVLIGVDHDIGTIPQAMGWVTYSTYNGVTSEPAIHPVATTNGNSQGVLLVVNEVEIVWVIPAFTDPHRAYYRIYLDE